MFMTLLVSHEEMSSLNVVSPHSLRKNRSDMSVISSVFHVEGWPWSRFGFRSVVPETPSVSLDASLTKPIQSWIHCFNSSFDCGVGTTVYLVDIMPVRFLRSVGGFAGNSDDLFGPRIFRLFEDRESQI